MESTRKPASTARRGAASKQPGRRRSGTAAAQPDVMSAEEVLRRLTEIARGDLGDFLTEGGEAAPAVDLGKAAASGKLRLLKRLKSADCSIELHDAYAALVQLGRHYRLFADRAHSEGRTTAGPPILEMLRDAEANGELDERFAETARLLGELSSDLAHEP